MLENLNQFRVRVFDPVVSASVLHNSHCYVAISELDTCDGADVFIVMTSWSQFCEIEPIDIAKRLRGKVVLDPHHMLGAAGCHGAG